MKILITGAAGFIGFHTVKHFAETGNRVVGIDNINNYYNVELKFSRLKELGIQKAYIQNYKTIQSLEYPNFRFIKADLQNKEFIDELFEKEHFDVVCNLAAQAGVRYSIENPYAYIDSNITGFLNILEACRFHPVKHLVYASSSSVYGLNKKTPYSETDKVNSPVSLYAASKRSNELMAHVYSKLYGIPTTGLRFFTVYGPWGRPDMAPYLFMDSIVHQIPINIFNNGKLSRDFTYIDDIVEGLSAVISNAPVANIPFKIYNIGHGKPVKLLEFIKAIENVTDKRAIKIMADMQKGDVFQTFANTSALERDLNYKPRTSIVDGISMMYQWYIVYSKRFDKRLVCPNQ